MLACYADRGPSGSGSIGRGRDASLVAWGVADETESAEAPTGSSDVAALVERSVRDARIDWIGASHRDGRRRCFVGGFALRAGRTRVERRLEGVPGRALPAARGLDRAGCRTRLASRSRRLRTRRARAHDAIEASLLGAAARDARRGRRSPGASSGRRVPISDPWIVSRAAALAARVEADVSGRGRRRARIPRSFRSRRTRSIAAQVADAPETRSSAGRLCPRSCPGASTHRAATTGLLDVAPLPRAGCARNLPDLHARSR